MSVACTREFSERFTAFLGGEVESPEFVVDMLQGLMFTHYGVDAFRSLWFDVRDEVVNPVSGVAGRHIVVVPDGGVLSPVVFVADDFVSEVRVVELLLTVLGGLVRTARVKVGRFFEVADRFPAVAACAVDGGEEDASFAEFNDVFVLSLLFVASRDAGFVKGEFEQMERYVRLAEDYVEVSAEGGAVGDVIVRFLGELPVCDPLGLRSGAPVGMEALKGMYQFVGNALHYGATSEVGWGVKPLDVEVVPLNSGSAHVSALSALGSHPVGIVDGELASSYSGLVEFVAKRFLDAAEGLSFAVSMVQTRLLLGEDTASIEDMAAGKLKGFGGFSRLVFDGVLPDDLCEVIDGVERVRRSVIERNVLFDDSGEVRAVREDLRAELDVLIARTRVVLDGLRAERLRGATIPQELWSFVASSSTRGGVK